MVQPAEVAKVNIANQERETLTLPIAGMACAACSARVEKGLNRTPGVLSAAVNLALQKGTVIYDPRQTAPGDIIASIRNMGFDVPVETVALLISGMSCAACSARVEKRLNALPGVEEAAVNLTTGKAYVKLIPGMITVSEVRKAVEALGYQARRAADASIDEEGAQRQKEIRLQIARFVLAAVLTLPLAWMMLSQFVGYRFMLSPWAQLVLVTPVQFVAGWPFYRGAFHSLRTTWMYWWRWALRQPIFTV
jgi:Cu+-exporting ATPase